MAKNPLSIISPAVCALTPEDSAIVCAWEKKCAEFAAANIYRPRVYYEEQWNKYMREASAGDLDALANLERLRTCESWCSIEQVGWRARCANFNNENAARCRDELTPVVQRIVAQVLKIQGEYRKTVEPWFKRLQLPIPATDGVLARLDSIVATCREFLDDTRFQDAETHPLSHYNDQLFSENQRFNALPLA